MICKIYYTSHFRGGHTESEVIFNFQGCECDERGITFTYSQNNENKSIFRSYSEVEDFNVMSVHSAIIS